MTRFALISAIMAGMVVMAFLVQAYHTSGNPLICSACHSMNPVASTWQTSNHKQFACVECHMPHGGIFSKLVYKTRSGLHDLWHETLRDYPANLVLSRQARSVVDGNCLRCHRSTVERLTTFAGSPGSCTRCHRHVVHHTSKRMEE